MRLAPLYDVASALPYYPRELKKLTLAMQVGGEYRLMRVGNSRWQRFAKEAGLQEEMVMGEVQELCGALPAVYEEVYRAARSAGLQHSILTTLGAMLQERARHLQRKA